ncbi:MAG: hypothetical protein KDJ37_04850 [Hyphomicrobiaceae bacterium]|nr:hypothetical protein [Hyphomicrobiaceae bacterium]
MSSRRAVRIAVISAVFCCSESVLQAAEFRLTFREVARLANRQLQGFEISLAMPLSANAFSVRPGVELDGPGGGDAVAEGGGRWSTAKRLSAILPAAKMRILGAEYAIGIDSDMRLQLGVSAVPGGLQFTGRFDVAAVRLRVTCNSGFCPAANAIPFLEWHAPAVIIRVAPVTILGGIGLEVRRVRINGRLRPHCSGQGGVAGFACSIALAALRPALLRLRRDATPLLRAALARRGARRPGIVALAEFASVVVGVERLPADMQLDALVVGDEDVLVSFQIGAD